MSLIDQILKEEFELAEGESPAVAGVLVGVSSVVGIVLALATYAAGVAFARTRLGRGFVSGQSINTNNKADPANIN